MERVSRCYNLWSVQTNCARGLIPGLAWHHRRPTAAVAKRPEELDPCRDAESPAVQRASGLGRRGTLLKDTGPHGRCAACISPGPTGPGERPCHPQITPEASKIVM